MASRFRLTLPPSELPPYWGLSIGSSPPQVYLLSEGDYDDSNGDGSTEIWRVSFE